MTPVSEKLPTRQGYFTVMLKDGTTTIAQYSKPPKGTEYIWQSWQEPSPFAEKESFELKDDKEVVSYDKVSQQAVDDFRAKRLTPDEKIEAAVNNSYRSFYFQSGSQYSLDVPECRKLEVGDKVKIGNLKNPEVVALFEEGKIVVAKYDFVPSRDRPVLDPKNGFDDTTQLWVGDWVDVFKLKTTEEHQLTNFATGFKLHGHMRNNDLDGLIHNTLYKGLVLNPIYQRDYVWTAEDKERLIESIFNSRNIGTFVFYYRSHPDGRLEVIDGKQRITAILDFFTSKITYKGKYFHELDGRDKYHFMSFATQFVEISGSNITQDYLIQVFLHVNSGGVPQEDAHLDKVRAMLKS